MRHLILISCSIVLLSSCRKDKREFTSDFPNGYRTDINIDYYESINTTLVTVCFIAGNPGNMYEWFGLALPADGYLKINGVEIGVESGYPYYQQELPGKPVISIEFKDYDGTIYANTMVPPDTAFFVNLPDTISSFDDLQLQVNAPNPDSSETSEICLDQHGFDYGYCHYTTDSLIDTENFPTLDGEMNHTIYLYRYKYHPNEHLPAVGGSITYRYIVERTFFTP